MRNVKLTLCALALAAVSTSSMAVGQGTVTFDGKLIAETCSIHADDIDKQVVLPTLSIQTLNASGVEAGSKLIELRAISCPANISVAAHFEAINSSGLDSTTGNLTNQFTTTGTTVDTTAATNVEVRLYNSDENQLKLGETGSAVTADSDGNATMNYYGGYYATGATTAGKVYAKALYTLAYP